MMVNKEAERRRQFYVALTRARDRLIIAARTPEAEQLLAMAERLFSSEEKEGKIWAICS